MSNAAAPLYFISSNENKFLEIQKLLVTEKKMKTDNKNGVVSEKNKIHLYFKKSLIKEIQSESILEVAEDKVKKAFDFIRKPVIIEDDGLFIEELNGFPGVYSSFVFKTIGNKGILNLLRNNENKRASFLSVITFSDGKTMKSFNGETTGHITTKIFSQGWGFDPIFIPEGETKTYGQIDIVNKNRLSHRSKAFKKFLEWHLQKT
jgi:XTP/dITP diphosphohydrolase